MKGKKGLTCIFTAFCACLVGTVLFTACDFKELTHTHAYTVNIQEATCTQKGLKTYTCSCGESYTEDIASLGHDFAEYISDNNATYKKDGTKTATCRREGCDTTDTVIDKGSKKEPTGSITFTTLTYEDEFLLIGSVSNATETFSFVNEVLAEDGATFMVGLDEFGFTVAPTKMVPLVVGDNEFYIFETRDDEIINTYKVVVRRRPIYTVTFAVAGGTNVDAQSVEEDGFAVKPETDKVGYTFAGWDYDFNQPITKDIVITASWTANKNTPYQVKHYVQNEDDNEYTLLETEYKTGETDTTVKAELKTFAQYKTPTKGISGTVVADGSLVLEVYYDYKTYTVNFNLNGGKVTSGQQTQTVKYGKDAVEPNVSRNGYTFVAWDKVFVNVTSNITVTASWNILTYQVSYDVNGGTIAKGVNIEAYTTETNFTLVEPQREYYEFLGWYEGDTRVTNFLGLTGALNLTAKWEYVFLFNGDMLTGMTEYGKRNYMTVVIPSEIEGTTITKIGAEAFADGNMMEITIPETITEIGGRAFFNCLNITTLRFNAVACNDVKESNFIFYHAGENTVGMTVIVGEKVTKIPAMLFCPYGRSWDTFESDSPKITKVVFEENSVCTEIREKAFQYCLQLVEVQLPDSLRVIQFAAFSNCESLQSVTFPKNLQTIGISAFQSTGLLEVDIPEKTVEIQSSAFAYSEALKRVSIPASVTSIGNSAFIECLALEELYYNANISAFDPYNDVFRDAGENGAGITVTIGKTVTTVPDYLFCPYDSTIGVAPKIVKVIFEEGNNCTVIGKYAFYNNSSLQEIQFPNTVTAIGQLAFYKCTSLAAVRFEEGLTEIGGMAFAYCKLKSVSIPKSVVTIGSSAFYYCEKLETVNIAEGVQHLGGGAFYGCAALTQVEIPDSIVSFGGSAFGGCNNLQYNEKDGLAYLGNAVHPYIILIKAQSTDIEELIIDEGCKYIDSYAFSGCKKLTSAVIGDNIKGIGSYAFSNCSKLTSVTIGDGVKTIGSYAFERCEQLTELVLGNSVESIGDYAFSVCEALTTIKLPNSVQTIGRSAFWYNINMTSIIIGKSIKSIDTNAFSSCVALQNVYYEGTESEWAEISIGAYNNTHLIEATKYYYSDSEPALNAAGTAYAGNYFKYGDNNEIIVWIYNENVA